MARRDKTGDSGLSAAEVASLAPYLDLAREIRDEVERFTVDDRAEVESLAEALDGIPTRERSRAASGVFERLSAEQQWAVLDRLFSEDELRLVLAAEHQARLAAVRRTEADRVVIAAAVADGRFDLGALREGTRVSLGLFRGADVRAALGRGAASEVCARLIVVRATATPGRLRVIDDVFNPRGALFVSAAYDESVWASERLPGHATVRLGSIGADGSASVLEPAVYLGARVDAEVDGELVEGRLQLGFALVGETDAFSDARGT
jgi:hypothetical protein